MNLVKIILMMGLICSYSIFPQSISIGLGGGVNFISGDNYYTNNLGRLGLYENINGTITNLEGMGLNNELQFQLSGKYCFEDSPFSLSAGFDYSPMRGSEQMEVYDFVFETVVIKDVTNKMDIWSFQVGANYSFYIYHIKPFITVSFLSNYFEDVFIVIGDEENFSQFLSYRNGMRYGYSIGAGIGYDIFSTVEINLSSNYNSFNVLNKREGEELLNSVNVLFNIYYKIL
ncbi:MAG: hypothetical protein MUO34_01145 [Ignavibacteriaceae bacterium]|nr:hypothetical protein [Ignavibacteriaceae bacterium]